MTVRGRSWTKTPQDEKMLISSKTRVECTAETLLPRRRARVGGLCGFPDTAERVPAKHQKTGRCADVRECPAELQHRSRSACGRLSAEGEAASGEAGQSRGVVRAPRRSHLPAVRAVSGIYEGVLNTAKNSRRALRNEKSPSFQGKQRGSDEKYEVNTKKW